MNLNTQKKFAALLSAMASSYGVADVTKTYAVDPVKAQEVRGVTMENVDFLSKINIVPVDNQSGEAVGIETSGMIAGRTNTTISDREARDPTGTSGTPYFCNQTNFDTYITYQKLDAWAHKKNFKSIVSQQILRLIALNKITIGWFGESVAADTDPAANPKGQDVAKGWIQKLREQSPENFLTEGATAGEIRIGTGGDYINLDVAVNDIKRMIDDVHQEDGDLVAIIGSELLGDSQAKFYAEHGNLPSEKSRIQDAQVIGTYGGLPAYKIPQFPSRGILVTSWKNLSIYEQNGTIRRRIEDNPRRDRIDSYYSENIDYVIENLNKIAGLEFKNVKVTYDDGTSWV